MLTVIGIMGVAFAFSMYLETQATSQFVSTTQARYFAEAGVNHARALLDEDRLGSRVDNMTEHWAQDPVGSDVDVAGSGTRGARWWPVTDADHQSVGHYAIQITDEAGKANLNAALAQPSPLELGAINLTKLLEQAGMDHARASDAAQAIERYRYGHDGRPGVAGVDDDGNGVIDDVSEYQPLALRGDDQRLESLEDLVAIAGLTPQEVGRLSRLATVYSWDLNVSVTGKPRVNVNTATANELVAVLLEAGVSDPWQVAANMADYVDADVEMSRVTKSSQPIAVPHPLPSPGAPGGWTWRDEPVGSYASDQPNTEKLSWSLSVPTGRFRVLVRGIAGTKVGDVTVAGQLHTSADDGESVGVLDLNDTLTVEVVNHEPSGASCAFRGIELVSEGTQSGISVRGIEAIRFNELMVAPMITLPVSSATFDPQGSDWGCPVDQGVCVNSGIGQGRWSWSNPLLQPGRYHVRVFSSDAHKSGQTVGEVRIEGDSQLLVDGQLHPSTISVGSDGKMSVTIGKTSAGQTYYLKGIILSLQPDAEYAEFINLSDRDIDMSGWTIEGELTGGRQARVPSNTVIKGHGFLVAAVDLDDQQTGLSGNGISARSAWQISTDVNAVQLEFPNGPPSSDDDWLKVSLPSGSAPRLMLRSKNGVTVDEVQYPLPPITPAPFQSLEKGDPTVIVDRNGDGIDEGWFPSLKLYTPGMPNNNEGILQVVGSRTIEHHPEKEMTIPNRPLQGIGELAGLPSGVAWKPFSSTDLAKIVDRLTVQGHRLEAEGHLLEADAAKGWEEKAEGYYLHTDPRQANVPGRWQWSGLSNGMYRLSLYGCQGCLGEQFSVRWQRQDKTFTDWSPPLTTDAQGRVGIGQVAIGMDGMPSHALILEVKCLSTSGICHFDNVRLDPQLIRVGPINVNTAPREVLLTLPGMTEPLADRIITGRPYGDRDGKDRGIGDVLMGDVLGPDEEGKLSTFRQFAHLLTTRSEVFQILSLGQAMNGARPTATQRIQAVIQR